MRRNVAVGLLLDYQQHLRRRGLARSTMSGYMAVLRSFIASGDPRKRTTHGIEAWLDDRRLGTKARYTYICGLAGFYAWLLDEGHIDSNPMLRVARPRIPKRYPRPITDEDLAKAMEVCTVRMRAWLCLAAYAGLRCKEIAGLDMRDLRLDVEPPVLHLSETKGAKDRIIPIGEELMQALNAYALPQCGPVFPALNNRGERTSKPLSPHAVSVQISRHLRGRGVAATAHQLRHWFGTEVYRRTLNPLLVRDLMGHADMTTTSGYMALVPSAAAIEAVRGLRAQGSPEPGQNTALA